MRKSELQKIIREEYRIVLREDLKRDAKQLMNAMHQFSKSGLDDLGLKDNDPFYKAWTVIQDKLANTLKN
jgi:biopolymer transport protein ExbD